MFKFFFALILLLSLARVSMGQRVDVTFIGALSVDGGADYPYKLFISDSNHILSGYSVTDIGGADETKTYIKGKVNPKKRQMEFRETRIAYTKSNLQDAELCFVRARLKSNKIKGATTLRGSFKGYKKDGKTECGKGKMFLVCAEQLLEKLLEIADEQNIERPKEDSAEKPRRYVVVHQDEVPSSEKIKIAPGGTAKVNCPAKEVFVDIWDAKTIDGDVVTLLLDTTKLLDHYRISGTHKIVPVELNGTAKLRLIAETEGSEPMNTANIRIISGGKEQYIDATTTIGKDVVIELQLSEQ